MYVHYRKEAARWLVSREMGKLKLITYREMEKLESTITRLIEPYESPVFTVRIRIGIRNRYT